MSIFDGSFAQLRQQLGLQSAPNPTRFPVDVGGLGTFGTDYLRSNQGANSLYDLFASGYDRSNPALAGLIRNNKSKIEDAYGAAAAADPMLQRDQFLQAYDPVQGLYKRMNFFQRGERPSAYQGRYRTLQS